MTTLSTLIDPASASFAANAAHNRSLAAELRRRVAATSLGGSAQHRERHVARGKLLPRDRVHRLLDPGSPFLEIGQLAANGMYDDGAPGAGVIAGIGRVSGRECLILAKRPHGEGGRLLSDDGKKAPARTGDRPREPVALPVSGGFGRRQPAAPGRRLSRPRSFRPHLLQPGADVGRRHPADRLRHGQLHCGRRLCAGDVGRNGDRAQPGHDLSRRTAIGEGGNRRSDLRRAARRRRDAWPQIRRGGSCCRKRQPRLADRALHRGHAQPREDRGHRYCRAAAAAFRCGRYLWTSCRRMCVHPTTCTR